MEAEEGRKGLGGGAPAGRKRFGGRRKSRGSETATCILIFFNRNSAVVSLFLVFCWKTHCLGHGAVRKVTKIPGVIAKVEALVQ